MRTLVVTTLTVGCILLGCSKEEEAPPPQTPAGYQQQPYPQQQTYPQQQQTYPQQQQTVPQQQTYPQQQTTPAPAGTAPAAGQMATPNAIALPCTSDAGCGLGKCNMQYQKCAFPCMSQVDCAANATCNTATGFCLPATQPAQ